jgi:hypothetical protein
LYGGEDIESDLDAIFFYLVASTIPSWRTFKLLRWVHLLNGLVDLNEILYCGNGIKGDLDHSRIALYVPQLITLNSLVDFHEIWYGCNAIQGDFDAIIFNPIVSITLKLLRSKFVR